ncbi:hypothetical protein [Parahaliea mediterranea]|uniref:hypothetical protein n=1 Tax=Parahaliea mediterranea TaxID=651086 RepID=UPI0013006547|nr:hypothetical protein [Parahaliea mediterranea]
MSASSTPELFIGHACRLMAQQAIAEGITTGEPSAYAVLGWLEQAHGIVMPPPRASRLCSGQTLPSADDPVIDVLAEVTGAPVWLVLVQLQLDALRKAVMSDTGLRQRLVEAETGLMDRLTKPLREKCVTAPVMMPGKAGRKPKAAKR